MPRGNYRYQPATAAHPLMLIGEDPDGDGYTVRTQQGQPIVIGRPAPSQYPSDAHEIRQRFNIPAFDPEAFYRRTGAALSGVYPDMLIHIEDAADGPDTVTSPKASLTLIEAPKGSGKSTAIDQFATYQMEHNGERIVRNGRQQSSDWRRLRDWTTLWLPEGIDVNGRWMEAVDRDAPTPEELVRAVRYYTDVFDLIEQLQDHPKGTFNVVYPDPLFRGCERAMAIPDTTTEQPKFTPQGEDKPTPVVHWWFGFLAARTFRGTRVDSDGDRNWMTVYIDEFGMLAPESTSGGEAGHWTYECVEIMSDTAKEMRSAGVSLVGAAHHEEDVHNHWLKEFDYWVELSNRERPNRTTKAETPKPFRGLKQDQNLFASRPPGYGLCYTESRFSEFQFTDLGYPHETPEFQFRLSVPESAADDESDDAVQVATDEAGQPTIVEEYTAVDGAVHELRVLAPGSGLIDIGGDEPEIVESPSSPYPDGSFPDSPLRETAEGYELLFERAAGEIIVAARVSHH